MVTATEVCFLSRFWRVFFSIGSLPCLMQGSVDLGETALSADKGSRWRMGNGVRRSSGQPQRYSGAQEDSQAKSMWQLRLHFITSVFTM